MCVCVCVCVCVVVVVVVVMVVVVVVDDYVVFMSLSCAYPPNSPGKHHSQAKRKKKNATQHLTTIKDTCPKTDSKGTAANACSSVGVFSCLSTDRELKETSSGETVAVEKARTAVCQRQGLGRSCCMAWPA